MLNEMIVTRAEAKSLGLARYFTGTACKHGHVAERITRSGNCTTCQTAFLKVWRVEHLVEMRPYHREYQRVRRSDPAVRNQDSADTKRRRNADPAAILRNRKAALAWAKSNPDKVADIRMRRRARIRAAFVEAVPRVEVFERDGWRCQICKVQLSRTVRVPHPKAPTVDHIVPLSKGGKHERKNLQSACYECNVRKGNRAADDQLLLVG